MTVAQTAAAAMSQKQLLQNELAMLSRAGQTVAQEVDTTLELVEGSVPAELRGVLYRNGPGRMERGGVRYGHPFDGDGMVTRFAFTENGVRYRNRFVRTKAYLQEEAAGRILFRNFGTPIPGGIMRNLLRLRFKNAANTSVVMHGGSLLALWEGGLPHRLDPETLETLGAHDYGGALRNTGPLSILASELPFSAHPRLDRTSGTLHNFGTAQGRQAELLLYKIQSSGALSGIERVPLSRFPFLHDFVLTPSYWVFYLAPVSFAAASMLLGLKTPVAALHGEDGAPAQLLLVPRRGGPPRYYTCDGGFIFHFAGGYEDEQGRVIIDGLRSARFPEFDRLWEPDYFAKFGYTPPRLTRFVVSPDKNADPADIQTELLCDHALELPTLHPALGGACYRYVYGIGSRPEQTLPLLHGLVKADVRERRVVFRDFGADLPGEPLFIPKAGGLETKDPRHDEDDGYVLSLVYRAQAHVSELLVLCAKDLRTLAVLRLPHHVPPGFHGIFVPAARA